MIMKMSLPLVDQEKVNELIEKHLGDKSEDQLLVVAIMAPEATEFARFLDSAIHFLMQDTGCTKEKARDQIQAGLGILNDIIKEAEELRDKNGKEK
jgi:hypothetical protein